MKTGLFFGSFNPIHIGHIRVAIEAYEQFKLDEVQFVISPQNPFKEQSDLLPYDDRCDMLYAAMKGFSTLKVSEVEKFLPVPSYTVDTLKYLQSTHKDTQFYLIMGQDCIDHFSKWKDSVYIIQHFKIIVFPRAGGDIFYNAQPNVSFLNVSEIGISSTQIRSKIKKGESISYLVPEDVRELILFKNYYK